MTIPLSYTEGADIGAPIERIFDYRLDYLTLAEYNPNVSNVRRTDGGSEPGAGAAYRFDLTIPGMGQMESIIRVKEVDRPRRIVQDSGTDYMVANEICTFGPLPGGGTRVEFTVELDLPDDAKDGLGFLEQSGREQLRIELHTLKKILES